MTNFLGALFVVVYGIVLLAFAFISITKFIEEQWGMEVVFTVCFVIMLSAALAIMKDENDSAMMTCLNSGGAWVKTGEKSHMVMVGKVLVPQTSNTYGCVAR